MSSAIMHDLTFITFMVSEKIAMLKFSYQAGQQHQMANWMAGRPQHWSLHRPTFFMQVKKKWIEIGEIYCCAQLCWLWLSAISRTILQK